jgi:hypothetical protein
MRSVSSATDLSNPAAVSKLAPSQTAIRKPSKAESSSISSAAKDSELGIERKRQRTSDGSNGTLSGAAESSEVQATISTVISTEEWGSAQTIKLPPYPQALKDFLAGDCEIWPGKKRSATHIVVPLFPQVDLDGRPAASTLQSLDQLDKGSGGPGFVYIWDNTPNNIPAEEEFHYAVMTVDVIPGTRYKTFAEQLRLLPAGYEAPGVFDVSRALLWTNRRCGRRCLSDNPRTFTHCKETIDGYQLIIGNFSPYGVSIHGHFYESDYIGLVGWRKF